MSKIESRIGSLKYKDEKIFRFLSNFNNFENLIPADRVKNWKSDEESCSFYVDGLGNAGLRIMEKEEFKTIKITSEEGTPISFLLWFQLKKVEESDTKIKLTLEPKLNAMMMAMVKKPLQDFVDMLVDQMEKLEFN
jgi:carbon monoxide dehydrogenase subunit G